MKAARMGADSQMDTEYRFNAAEWDRLTAAQRMHRCRLMAEEAQTLAETAPLKIREDYLNLATQWLALAREIELQAVPTPTINDEAPTGLRR